MKKINYLGNLSCLFILLSAVSFVSAQRRSNAKPSATPKPIIFAVLDDGKTLEPIAQIEKGKLIETTSGESEPKEINSFVKTFYKPKTKYGLIFGGKLNGTVTVKSSEPTSECAKNLASASTISSTAKLKGFVMGLATNGRTLPTAKGVRRLPTYSERVEIESLVRDEFARQSVAESAIKNLHYYNLTALDVDNDGTAEQVGSFWVESGANERNLLFFIAEKEDGKYKFGYSDYAKVTPEDVMSGDLKDLDKRGGELLLDVYDYDGDKTAEVFTIVKAFEGNNFYVYNRQNGKWTKSYETYNYHCAY